MIDTIIFDAEGVIIDTEPMWDKAQEEFLRRRGLVYDRDKVKHLLSGRSVFEGTEILKTECGFDGDVHALVKERMDLVKAQIEASVQFIPGFSAFYQQIAPRYKTAIATALAEELLASVEHRLGVGALFRGHVYSLVHVGYRSKPNPDLFLHAARQLGSTPQNCLVIEDAPHGIEAARRAGMKCIALATTYARSRLAGADRVVDSYAEIDLMRFTSSAPAIS